MCFRKCWPHKGRHSAKAERLTVIADASENDEKLVASLGADIVVRRGDDVASRIRSHFAQGVGGSRTGRSQKWEKVDRLRQLVEAGKIRLRASWMTQPP
jgi:hypothetical protein